MNFELGSFKRPLQGIVILVIAALIFLVVSNTFAQNRIAKALAGGELLDVECQAEEIQSAQCNQD